MSSDGFAVDLEALNAAGDRVGRLAGDLAEPSHEVPSASVFGHDRLADAIDKFAAQEEDSRTRLTAEVESIRDRLAETVRSYRQADEDGAERFKDIAT
ncbi:hypothetical protein LWC34_02960 [Kibdelosporangium philippinense]|uniref:Excreted virulence factor EspC, type VII ESX diderm n=1 Tax=Kibdelosporangium philippinense TaxID=211113 RepID=A0ABS8Z1T3_9PSEU|nr:hypothetical protein [Kibdelosporangium philippinense]MCE7001805.1 hypothetical protein [Kibdelosporangium philippinense]